MKVYIALKRQFASPLARYIPVGAHICRWEYVAKIVINDAPESEDLLNVLVNGVEYDDPTLVT
jgi:hypothetical protein